MQQCRSQLCENYVKLSSHQRHQKPKSVALCCCLLIHGTWWHTSILGFFFASVDAYLINWLPYLFRNILDRFLSVVWQKIPAYLTWQQAILCCQHTFEQQTCSVRKSALCGCLCVHAFICGMLNPPVLNTGFLNVASHAFISRCGCCRRGLDNIMELVHQSLFMWRGMNGQTRGYLSNISQR